MSSRSKNILKVLLVLTLLPLVAFLLLIMGISAKSKRISLEGAAYAAVFLLAMAVPEGSPLYGVAAVLGLASIGASALRSYQLRHLWLSTDARESRIPPFHHDEAQVTSRPSPPPGLLAGTSTDLSSALAWVAAHAKQNKHRLPSNAYVTILECCQTLDAVVDAERQQPCGDAQFEYELEAIVKEYLPMVLRSYLAIPPSMANNRQPNGRTPDEELTEQLELISGQAEALHSSRHGQTSAELTNTGNFLRERFGHRQRGKFDFGIE